MHALWQWRLLKALLDFRLGQAEDFENTLLQRRIAAAALVQARQDLLFEHGNHFPGDTGQKVQIALTMPQVKSGCRAETIGEDYGLLRQKRLFFVARMHLLVSLREETADLRQGFVVENQPAPESARCHPRGKIVVGGAESSGADNDLAPGGHVAQGGFDVGLVVTDGTRLLDGVTLGAQKQGDARGIGVGHFAVDQFIAGGQDRNIETHVCFSRIARLVTWNMPDLCV